MENDVRTDEFYMKIKKIYMDKKNNLDLIKKESEKNMEFIIDEILLKTNFKKLIEDAVNNLQHDVELYYLNKLCLEEYNKINKNPSPYSFNDLTYILSEKINKLVNKNFTISRHWDGVIIYTNIERNLLIEKNK